MRPYLGPHEPIPTKFGLWMFFIMLHQYMVSETLKCKKKKKKIDVASVHYCIFDPSLVVIGLQLFKADLNNKNLTKLEHPHTYTQMDLLSQNPHIAFQARGIITNASAILAHRVAFYVCLSSR